MKKSYLLFVALLIVCSLFFSCNVNSGVQPEKLFIVTSNFSAYDFARQLCGDLAEIVQLIPFGSESHSYEPTPKDIMNISKCDLFICVGGESESWIDKILDSIDTPINTIKMIESVDLLEIEHEHQGHSVDYDEHVWTSISNCKKIISDISKKIKELDPENTLSYNVATELYYRKLEKLDSEFKEFFQTRSKKILIFGDRFPFAYFANEYDLECYCAYPGCGSETMPDPTSVMFLIDKIRNEGISTVFYIEFSNHTVADSIAEETDTKTALLHSCHNVTKDEFESGETYISLMKKNLETLKGAL